MSMATGLGVRLGILLALLITLLASDGGLGPAPARAQEVLGNEAVLAMSRAGLPDAVIVAKLRSTATALDTRAEALIALKQAGVSDRVLEAIVASASAQPVQGGLSRATPGGPPIQSSPEALSGMPPLGPPLPTQPSPSLQSALPPLGPMPPLPPLAAQQPDPFGGSTMPPLSSGPGPGPTPAPSPGGPADGLGAFLQAVKGIADLVASSNARPSRSEPQAEMSAPLSMTAPAPAMPALMQDAPPLPQVMSSPAAPPPAPQPAPADAPLPAPAPPVVATPPAPPSETSPPRSAGGGAPAPMDFAPQRGRLGIRFDPLMPEQAQSVGARTAEGLVVREVFAGSAAAAVGLRPGDVITKVNGQAVRSAPEMQAALGHRMRGERTSLSIVRAGAVGEIVVPAASEFPPTGGRGPAARPAPAAPSPAPGTALASVAGTYRCWMFNVAGAGGRCRTATPLVLRADGSYEESSTRGSWTVRGDRVVLSASTVRGPGRLEGGNRIVFEYEYNGRAHRVTYLRQDGSAAEDAASPPAQADRATPTAPPAAAPAQAAAPARVPVELTIRFAPSDGSVGWINSVALIPAGGSTGPEALGRTDGKRTVAASFRTVEAGRVYAVHVSSGLHRWPVGSLDLRGARGPVAVTLEAPAPAPGPKAAVAPAQVAPASAPAPAASAAPAGPAAGKPCDPRMPRYAQKGCVE